MESKYPQLSDVQEILLWQRLNTQLRSLRRRGYPIRDSFHQRLYNFCLDQNLFSEITSNPILLDIPLSIVSDFKRVSFVTINQRTWTGLLQKLLRGSYNLNVSRALGESFNDLEKLNLDMDESSPEDSDQELHRIIHDYSKLKKAKAWDFAEITNSLYMMKTSALHKLINRFQSKPLVEPGGTILMLNVKKKDVKEAHRIYIEIFCKRAQSLTDRLGSFTEILEVYAFLDSGSTEPRLRPYIKSFLDNERDILVNEEKMLLKFKKGIEEKLHGPEAKIVNVCNTSGLYFLDNPLPTI